MLLFWDFFTSNFELQNLKKSHSTSWHKNTDFCDIILGFEIFGGNEEKEGDNNKRAFGNPYTAYVALENFELKYIMSTKRRIKSIQIIYRLWMNQNEYLG